MSGSEDVRTCTIAERAMLDMIAARPGVPTLVTMETNGRFSVYEPDGSGPTGGFAARAEAALDFDQAVPPVSHDRAKAAAKRLIASHFGRSNRARATVPPRPEQDDDFVLMSYIRQRRAADDERKQPLMREQFGLPPEQRSAAELQAAEEEQDSCDLAYANGSLRERSLARLSEGGAALDDIFAVLQDADMLHRSGGVLLSPEATLHEAPLLFIGLNPGGDEEELEESTILRNLVSCRMGLSAWNEQWKGEPGNSLLQRRFKQVAAFIGVDPLAIPSTNVVFTRSRDVASHRNWAEDRRATLAVHEILAATVRPSRLWFMGNPDAAGELLTDQQLEWRESSHGRWGIGHGTAVYAGRPVILCHTPHLSRWDPAGKEEELRFAFGMSSTD